MADPTVSAVTSTAKADAAKAESAVQSELTKLRADLAALEAKSFSFKSVSIVAVVAFVVGVLTRFL